MEKLYVNWRRIKPQNWLDEFCVRSPSHTVGLEPLSGRSSTVWRKLSPSHTVGLERELSEPLLRRLPVIESPSHTVGLKL